MRKIPTLFQRDWTDPRRPVLTDRVEPSCAWVLTGEGVATRKYDGTCVLIRCDGRSVHAFTRREVKPGRQAPAGFVAVETDESGATVGWEPGGQSSHARPLAEALQSAGPAIGPGTYELCGPKVNGNPERFYSHVLVRHADAQRVRVLNHTPRGIVETVRVLAAGLGWEGLVWHTPDGRMAKLKARDLPEGTP